MLDVKSVGSKGLNGQGYGQLLRILSHPERVGKMAACNRVDLTALNKA